MVVVTISDGEIRRASRPVLYTGVSSACRLVARKIGSFHANRVAAVRARGRIPTGRKSGHYAEGLVYLVRACVRGAHPIRRRTELFWSRGVAATVPRLRHVVERVRVVPVAANRCAVGANPPAKVVDTDVAG